MAARIDRWLASRALILDRPMVENTANQVVIWTEKGSQCTLGDGGGNEEEKEKKKRERERWKEEKNENLG